MLDSLPTESVSGQDDWEWTRSQATRSAPRPVRPRPAEPAESPPRTPATSTLGHGDASDQEPARSDPQLESVIHRYERLLEEKDEQLAGASDGRWAGRTGAVVQAIRRVIASW